MKKKPSGWVNALFLILSLLCLVYYLLNGFCVRFGQSLLWVWPLIAGALLLRWALVRHMIKTGAKSPLPAWFLRVTHVCVALALAIFLSVEGVIASGLFPAAPKNLDYIVILGARVNGREPSGALRNRTEVAAEYLLANPDTLAVASGGQGEDEEISEAACILEGLVARGVAGERVLLEEKSTSTVENMRFSFELIGDREASVGVVTNDFHMFRALATARKYGDYDFYGVRVATSLLSFPHYMLREFAATVIDALRGNLALS